MKQVILVRHYVVVVDAHNLDLVCDIFQIYSKRMWFQTKD